MFLCEQRAVWAWVSPRERRSRPAMSLVVPGAILLPPPSFRDVPLDAISAWQTQGTPKTMAPSLLRSILWRNSHILKLSGGGTYIKEITGNPPHADKAGFRKSYCEKPKTKVRHNLGLWPSCLTVAFFDDQSQWTGCSSQRVLDNEHTRGPSSWKWQLPM